MYAGTNIIRLWKASSVGPGLAAPGVMRWCPHNPKRWQRSKGIRSGKPCPVFECNAMLFYNVESMTLVCANGHNFTDEQLY